MRVLIGTTVQNIDRVDMHYNKLVLKSNDEKVLYYVYIKSLSERKKIMHQLLKNGWADLSGYEFQ